MTTTRQNLEILALAVLVLVAVPVLRRSGIPPRLRLWVGLGVGLFILLALRMLS